MSHRDVFVIVCLITSEMRLSLHTSYSKQIFRDRIIVWLINISFFFFHHIQLPGKCFLFYGPRNVEPLLTSWLLSLQIAVSKASNPLTVASFLQCQQAASFTSFIFRLNYLSSAHTINIENFLVSDYLIHIVPNL